MVLRPCGSGGLPVDRCIVKLARTATSGITVSDVLSLSGMTQDWIIAGIRHNIVPATQHNPGVSRAGSTHLELPGAMTREDPVLDFCTFHRNSCTLSGTHLCLADVTSCCLAAMWGCRVAMSVILSCPVYGCSDPGTCHLCLHKPPKPRSKLFRRKAVLRIILCRSPFLLALVLTSLPVPGRVV